MSEIQMAKLSEDEVKLATEIEQVLRVYDRLEPGADKDRLDPMNFASEGPAGIAHWRNEVLATFDKERDAATAEQAPSEGCAHKRSALMGGEVGDREHRCEVWYCLDCRSHRICKKPSLSGDSPFDDSGWVTEEEMAASVISR